MNTEVMPCKTCITSLEQSMLYDEVTCFKTCRDWARWKGMRVVAIGGHFDPFHEGHLLHIVEASKLGDLLYVFVSSDEDAIRKKGKVNIRQSWRIEIVRLIVRGLGVNGIVLPTLDEDGTQAKTLRRFRPDIFAKGGDRTPNNMPQSEIEVCEEIGCKIVYGAGKQLNESSKMVMV